MVDSTKRIFSQQEFLVLILLLFFSFFSVFISRYERLYDPDAISSKDGTDTLAVYLEEPGSFGELIRALEEREIQYDEEELKWAGRIFGWNYFRPGRYEIKRYTNYNEFLSRLTRGRQDPVNIRIRAGSSPERFSRDISSMLKADSLAFVRTLRDSSLLNEHELDTTTLFGRMLPNTYQEFWTAPPKSFINRILDVFNKRIAQRYEDKIEELEYSLDEMLTLASIVEWEAKLDSEKKRISGLYWNRLKRGMRLQADPTVLYALGERRRILYEDYDIDHPFNTYKISGLPPGPITNPSQSSIEAALYPEDHDYLYMVAVPDSEGEHGFSETYSEHRRKSRKWQQWIREQYRKKRMKERQQSQ